MKALTCVRRLGELGRYALLGCTLWAALSWTGCAALVPKGEYRSYRAVRMAPKAMTRLQAMRDYLDQYPDGRWAQEFRAAQAEQEALVFEENRDNREGLGRYLQLYPQGLFSEQARSRLSVLSLLEARRRDQQARAQKAAAQRRAEEDDLHRTWVYRFTGELLGLATELTGWNGSIAQLAKQNPRFSAVLGRPPRPRCSPSECLKYYQGLYTLQLPQAGTLERNLQLILRVRMEDDKVIGMDILMPGWGFSRWYENEHGALVVDDESAARKAAVDWAVDRIQTLLAAHGSPTAVRTPSAFAFDAPTIGPVDEFVDTRARGLSTVMVLPGREPQGSVFAEDGRSEQEAEEPMEEIELGIIEVAEEGSAVAPQGVVSIEADTTPPAVVAAYRLGKLKIQVFAAGGDAQALSYDGIRIEP